MRDSYPNTAPQMAWTTVIDHAGRTRLEMHWSVPTASSSPAVTNPAAVTTHAAALGARSAA